MISDEYAAGFFDGEGCVNLMDAGPKHRARRPILRIILSNTFRGALEIFKERFGGYIHWYSPKGNRKEKGHWTITEGPAVIFLQAVLPHLVVKRKQAELAIEFWKFVQRPYAEKIETTASPDEWVIRRNGARARKLIKFCRPEYLEACQSFKEKMGEMNHRGKAESAA